MFEMTEYAKGRLERTVVMYNDHPFFVDCVGGARQVALRDLDTMNRAHVIHLDDPNLSFQPPRVGYINTEGGARYLSRTPERRWKQGTSKGSLKTAGGGGVSEELFYSKGMIDCFKGDYPNFEEAVIRAKEIGASVAFHRNMAVNHLGSLFFRGNRMGKVTEDGVKLMTVFKCLEGMFGGDNEDL